MGFFKRKRVERPTIKNLENINELLADARKFGLVSEVIGYALYYMKINSKLTYEEALNLGLDEFDV